MFSRADGDMHSRLHVLIKNMSPVLITTCGLVGEDSLMMLKRFVIQL